MKPTTGEILERAILDDPDDIAAHAAYADWLTQQGDPRGEFIQVQLALEDESRSADERRQLQRRETELLQAHEAEWVGDWTKLANTVGPSGRGQLAFAGPKFGFIRGILAEVTLDSVSVECARAFIRAPQTRLVRRLSIGGWPYQEPGEYEPGDDIAEAGTEEPARYILQRWPHFGNLRHFQLGWTSDEDYGDFCHFQCHLRAPFAVKWIEQMPRLEELYLFADSVPTDQLFQLKTLTNLRVMQIYHCWEYPLERLAANTHIQRLSHVLLHPKASGAWADVEAPYITFDGVRAILRSHHAKTLTHLRLRLTDIGDPGCEEIVRSGILGRLKMLDLRHGAMTDAGAQLLAASPDIKTLEVLDLSRNQLTEAGVHAVQAVLPDVHTELQQTPQEIAQGEYLYQGDYE